MWWVKESLASKDLGALAMDQMAGEGLEGKVDGKC